MTPQLQYGMGGDRPYGLYYEHSGQTPVLSILIAGVLGIAAGIVAALAYAYLMAYMPGSKLGAIAAVAFGGAVGAATTFIARAGKVRSTPVVLALVGVCTLVAYYFAWVFWIKAVLGRGETGFHIGVFDLISNPNEMIGWIREFNESGTFKRRASSSDAVKGVFLTLGWIAELVAIFGCSFGVVFPLIKSQMFCEKCKRWCGSAFTVRRTQPGDPVTTVQTLEAHDMTYVASLPPSTGGQFWDVKLHSCPSCRELNGLSISQTTQSVDKKGKVVGTAIKPIIEKLLISRAEADYVRAPGSAVAQEQMGMQPAYPVTPPLAVPGYVVPPAVPGRTPPPPLPPRR